MKQIELKPCPFCGGKAKTTSHTECGGHGLYIEYRYVACTECRAKGPYTSSFDKCISNCEEAWNRRADDEQREITDKR